MSPNHADSLLTFDRQVAQTTWYLPSPFSRLCLPQPAPVTSYKVLCFLLSRRKSRDRRGVHMGFHSPSALGKSRWPLHCKPIHSGQDFVYGKCTCTAWRETDAAMHLHQPRSSWAIRASLIAQLVTNPPAMQETLVWLLGQKDPLKKGQATHSSTVGFPCGSASKESVRTRFWITNKS